MTETCWKFGIYVCLMFLFEEAYLLFLKFSPDLVFILSVENSRHWLLLSLNLFANSIHSRAKERLSSTQVVNAQID